jgi:tetratricopeptide (TPR) repeat protein
MLDLQTEQHDLGQAFQDLYEAVADLKRRHDLHPCAVRPRDGLALRRDSEREQVQDLVKRFRELPREQQRRLPALLNSLAQLEVVVGDLEAGQRDFQEVVGLVADPLSQAEAHHNVYRAALERRDWSEALAALRRAAGLDREAFEPFSFARYEPLRILGAGGFGVTFLCQDHPVGERVVLRALRADSLDRDPGAVLHEMEALQELDHPALIRVRDCDFGGPGRTRPYLVLDYFEGRTLTEYVAEHGPLTPEDWLQVCWPVARALQAAHGRGVLHRSLRPGCVLVRREKGGAGWRVKLLDAGLSLKRALIHATASNPAARAHTALGRSVTCTLPFAPSEVVGKPKGQVWVGPHSDVYSFGKLCAFALTGRPDPDAGDRALLPEPWRQLLDDCTAWVVGRRPEHFGLVLDCLAALAGNDLVGRIEHDMHETTVAEHTAALQADPGNVGALVNRGNAYARQGDFEKALADYTEALRLHPDDPSLLRRRALAHARRQDLDAALADYTEALRLEPRNVEAHANRGLAHAQKGDFEKALADYTEALLLTPRDAVLLYNRGNAHYGKGDYERAAADYTEALRLDPRNVWAFGNRGKAHALRGDHPRAVADFTRVLQLDPGNGRALADRAASHAALGRHDRAVADYTEALRLEPAPALYTDRALAHAALDDLDAAVSDLTEALALDPAHLPALVLRGNLRCDRGEFDAALADYSRALELDPADPATLCNRAAAYARRGDHDRALADYAEALRLDPGNAHTLSSRGNLQAERGDLDAAVADYTEAVRQQPDYAPAYYNRGNARAERGDFDGAVADFTEALRLEPGHAAALNNRGNARLRQGDVEQALADFAAAVAADPDFALAYYNRANTLSENGRPEEALADYTQVIRLDPDDLGAYHNRGRVYALLGDHEHALADNLEALRRAPDDARTCNNLAWLWATSPRPEYRDPARAVEYARKACERTGDREPGYLDTLAVALAAAGRFAEAAEVQRRAVELAPEAEKADYRSRLELYEAGKPYQEPVRGA